MLATEESSMYQRVSPKGKIVRGKVKPSKESETPGKQKPTKTNNSLERHVVGVGLLLLATTPLEW